MAAVLLGLSGVAVLAQANNLLGISRILGLMGMHDGIVRHLSRRMVDNPASAASQFATVLLAGTLFGGLVAVLFYTAKEQLLALSFSQTVGVEVLVVIAALIPCLVISQIMLAFISSIADPKWLAAFKTVPEFASVAVFWPLAFSYGVVGALLATAVLYFAKILIGCCLLAKFLTKHRLRLSHLSFERRYISENMGFGLTALITTLSAALMYTVLLKAIFSIKGEAAAGAFSTVWRLGTVYFAMLFSSVGSYLFPRLAQVSTAKLLNIELNQALIVYQKLAIFVLSAMAIAPALLLEILFSSEFAMAAGILLAFLPGELFRISTDCVAMTVLANKHLRAYSVAYIIWAAVFLGGAFLLLEPFGILGAAIWYSLSRAAYFFGFISFCAVRFEIRVAVKPLAQLGLGAALLFAVFAIFHSGHHQTSALLAGVFTMIWGMVFITPAILRFGRR